MRHSSEQGKGWVMANWRIRKKAATWERVKSRARRWASDTSREHEAVCVKRTSTWTLTDNKYLDGSGVGFGSLGLAPEAQKGLEEALGHLSNTKSEEEKRAPRG